MKKPLILFLIIYLSAIHLQAQLVLTAEQCRQMALESNEDVKIAGYQYEKAVIDKKSTRTSYLPKIAGSATYAYLFEDIDMGMDFDLSAMGMPGVSVPIDMAMSMKGAYMAGITLQQPIYAGGKIVTGNKMADKGVEITEENKRLAQMTAIAEAENGYWVYVSVKEKVKLLEKYNDLLDSLFRNVENYTQVQMATENDLQKVRTRRSNLRYELQKARNGLELSRMSLCRMIGVDMETSIIAVDTVITVQKENDYSYDLALRPEYRILQKQLELKEMDIKLTRADFLPVIGASAGYTYVGGLKMAGSDLDMSLPMVMASVSIPIFHFGEGSKKIKSARIARQMSELELEKNTKLMNIEVQNALKELQSSFMMIETAEDAYAEAESNLRLNKDNYELQMGTLIDVLDAQTQWQEAYSNIIEAKANYKIKEVEYNKATGRL
ncbi:MAG: TolC family protein [Bacteroidales bacterium]|jgi:outer membrane protein TolC|nr:TolC family protein [Bacteroidales bacterium]